MCARPPQTGIVPVDSENWHIKIVNWDAAASVLALWGTAGIVISALHTMGPRQGPLMEPIQTFIFRNVNIRFYLTSPQKATLSGKEVQK